MNNKFEDYLKGEHMKGYRGCDDDAPDAYEDWLGNLDSDLWIAYAERFGSQKALDAVVGFGKKLNL